MQAHRPLQQRIVDETIKYFGRDNVFNNIINNHTRLEWYTAQGVQFEDFHDKRIFALYADIFKELLLKIKSFEKTGNVLDFKYEHEFINKNRLTEKGKGLTLSCFTEEGQ